ncbi:MAG: hypothetical protein GY754_12495 [bacterium]|nr:hypothetical protein [bacterium]
MKKTIIFSLALSVLFLTIGCKKVKPDQELMGAIQDAASKCTIDLKYAFVKDCEEIKKVAELIKKKTVPASVATVSVALNDKDEKVRAVACKLLYREIKDRMHEIEKKPELVSDAVAENLITGVSKIKTYIAFYAAASVTHISMIKGKQKKLYTMLEKHPIVQVRYEAYENLMKFGRLKAFNKIQELADKKYADKWLGSYIMKAPIRMYKYTDEEKKAVGDWALKYLENENPLIAVQAASALNRCGGKYIDAVLDACDKLAKENKLTPPFSQVLTNNSISCKSFFGSKPSGTEEQCKRLEELKKKIKK